MGLLGIVDGTEEKPTSGSTADWVKKDYRARAIIVKTLDDVHFNHVVDCTTAKEIMDRLVEIREPKTVNEKLQAYEEFMAFS